MPIYFQPNRNSGAASIEMTSESHRVHRNALETHLAKYPLGFQVYMRSQSHLDQKVWMQFELNKFYGRDVSVEKTSSVCEKLKIFFSKFFG